MRKIAFEWNKTKYETYYITTAEDAEKAVTKLEKNPRKLYGLDIETGKVSKYRTFAKAGLCPHLSFIRLIQIFDGTNIWVFDWRNIILRGDDNNTNQGHTRQPDTFLRFLREHKFIAHNAIFEIKHFQKAGIEIDCICSMILAQFVETANHSPFEPTDEEAELRYLPTKGFGLNSLIQKYFGLVIPKEQQVSDWNKKVLSKEQILYASLDAVLTYELGKYLYPMMVELKMQKAFKLYKEMQYVIADMELNGMGFDRSAHNALITEWKNKEVYAKAACKEYFGSTNLRSPKQLHEWVENNIDDDLKKIWPRSAKTDKFSFNKTEVAPIIDKCFALRPFMEYKKYAALLSTFGVSLQNQINPCTNRIHCSFSLGHTRTGRLSSREPNLQNMPARDDSFRHIFIPSKGCVLVVADFSQIEIRVAGELSKDLTIRNAYKNNEDLHKAIVAELEGKDIKLVTKEERQLGKAINFGLQFGMGPKKLGFYAKTSYGIALSDEAAKKAWATYHSKYATYSKWCNLKRAKAERIGWVRTPMGKVRKLAEGEYYTKAINTPVQGGAAEISYASLIELRRQLKNTNCNIKIINTVHDEIIIECPNSLVDYATKVLKQSMMTGMLTLFPHALGLESLVEVNSGQSWAAAK